MTRTRARRDPRCDCGCEYDAFRTGLRFTDVQAMLWVASDDPRDWRHKRRNTVLGLWRSLKIRMFNEAHSQCSERT